MKSSSSIRDLDLKVCVFTEEFKGLTEIIN
jgi:hypothetical protein